MEFLMHVLDIVRHLDEYLTQIVETYHGWTYLILWLIIFFETGLVVTPFLPGDSLLFAAGALCARDSLNLPLVLGLLSIAAVVGDAVNYSIGYFFGPGLIAKSQRGGLLGRLIKPEYLDRTHKFYEKHGKKTIILARFVPIVRTFAPFMAGMGSMRYTTFAAYNVIGGLLWVVLLTLAGVFFGDIPWVKKNFEVVVIGIVAISLLPLVYEYLRARHEAKQARLTAAAAPVKEAARR